MRTVTIKGKSVALDYVADLEATGAVGRRGAFYRVTFKGEVLVASSVTAPFDACRVLRERGLEGMIGFKRGDAIGMAMSIRWGAKHTISETKGTPRATPWREYDQDAQFRVAGWARNASEGLADRMEPPKEKRSHSAVETPL